MISVGAKREEKVLVTNENAISFLGLEEARVLATPQMILHMERTCRNLVLPMLEPGHDTVGTHVDVYHLAAAPIGSAVRFLAELTAATERRVNFRVEAWNEQEKVGEGTHERAIVNVAKFATRVARKKA
jgi:predicted thioesterase